MNLSDLHRRLLSDVLAIGAVYPLVITGGHAVQAHGLVDRLSQDLDVATENPAPMEEITRTVTAGLTARGWEVREIGIDPLSGRLVATGPASGEQLPWCRGCGRPKVFRSGNGHPAGARRTRHA